jgi:hydroxyethylthiazole kinase-like uncharacterized protein yjeF
MSGRTSEPPALSGALLTTMPLPRPDPEADKEERGRVLIAGGDAEVPGAARLAGEAALRAGAGKLQIAVAAESASLLAVAVPEARVFALAAPDAEDRLAEAVRLADAVVLGPGWLDPERSADLTLAAIEAAEGAALVIDAAALSALERRAGALSRLEGRAVITPHAGEMAKLLGRSRKAVLAAPLSVAHEAAERFGTVVVMKGATTHIVAPDGRAWRNLGGGAGLGTSGSGDVLAGLIGGLLARGAEPAVAATWGVFLHAAAGEQLGARQGPLGFLAREIAPCVPGLLRALG